MKLSIIVPCYNEEEVLPLFYKELKKSLVKISNFDFEVIFVNDGSKDKTLDVIKSFKKTDSMINYISFSRNFGKEAAIYAGLQASHGNLTVLMDADLQDPPSLLPKMVELIIKQGYDSVATYRSSRVGEPQIRSFFANCFYKFINKISKTQIQPGSRDFRMMNRKFLNAVLSLSEYNRFTKGIFPYVGFKTKWIAYNNINRPVGNSKWSFFKLCIYALNGITAFSTAPLFFSSLMGILLCLCSVIGIIYVIIRECLYHVSAYGWPSLLCVILFIGGIQLLSIGILGHYLAKTYLETKHRPQFIVDESTILK